MIFFYINCKTSLCQGLPNYEKNTISNSRSLTKKELEKVATKFGNEIILNFQRSSNPKLDSIAILQTNNDTSYQLEVEGFEIALASTLLKGKIHSLRTDKKKENLRTLPWGSQLCNISPNECALPNYYIQTIITENAFEINNAKYIKIKINLELTNILSHKVVFRTTEFYQREDLNKK